MRKISAVNHPRPPTPSIGSTHECERHCRPNHRLVRMAISVASSLDSDANYATLQAEQWRDGRVAEGGGLLNRYTVKSRIGGSNPPLSASPRKVLFFQPSYIAPKDNFKSGRRAE